MHSSWVDRLTARSCAGSWGSAYAEQHRRILSGEAKQRYLVVQSFSGLADNLVFITGMLYVAVLTQSAIQIAENWLPYSVVYDKPNVDWRYRLEVQATAFYQEAALDLFYGLRFFVLQKRHKTCFFTMVSS